MHVPLCKSKRKVIVHNINIYLVDVLEFKGKQKQKNSWETKSDPDHLSGHTDSWSVLQCGVLVQFPSPGTVGKLRITMFATLELQIKVAFKGGA